MTTVKQRAYNIINRMPDQEVEQFVMLNIRYEQAPLRPNGTVRDDIAQSGIDFGPEYTDENHDERMAHAFELAKNIEIDDQAIKDLREASMI